MKVGISAEYQIDIAQEELDKRNIRTVHMQINQGEETYQDNEKTLEELFAWTKETGNFCHTAAANIDTLKAYFDSLLEEYDEIVHIAISSAMSSQYQNAMIAADGNPRIHIVDSLDASGGTAVYVFYANDLRDAGYSADEIVEKLMERRGKVECSFQIDGLEYLHRGGRCSKVVMLGANILKIKPEIVCGKDGKLTLGKLHRGPQKKVVKDYFDHILSQKNIDKRRAVMEYSTLDEAGMKLFQECVKRMKDFGFEEIVAGQCASAISAYHAGPNIIGAQFMIDGPHPIEKKN